MLCSCGWGYQHIHQLPLFDVAPVHVDISHIFHYDANSINWRTSTCTSFTAVGGQFVGLRLCSDIAYDFDITVDQLTSWNPWIGADCGTGVYSGLAMGNSRAVCVGVSNIGGPISSLATTLPQQQQRPRQPPQRRRNLLRTAGRRSHSACMPLAYAPCLVRQPKGVVCCGCSCGDFPAICCKPCTANNPP